MQVISLQVYEICTSSYVLFRDLQVPRTLLFPLFSQASSRELLRAGKNSANWETNFSQFWKSELNVSTKVRFFQLQFHNKKNPSRLNVFTRKNKWCYIYLPVPYNRLFFYRDHQTVTRMNYFCYCYDGL